jgi:dolichol-phosphate mannosyltransferase
MISIIIPTLNESSNIARNCDIIDQVLSGIEYEIIFVDDMSTDKTFSICQEIGLANPKVRSILRHGRTGLSSAAIEGMLSARFDILCVVDADLQYDLQPLRDAFYSILNGSDLAILTRTMLDNNNVTNLQTHRRVLTQLAAKFMIKVVAHDVKDPNSGFFVIKKAVLLRNLNKISGVGFKLLLDILMSDHDLKIAEVKTTFNDRQYGESKMSSRVFIDLFEMMIDKYTGSTMFGSFVLYALCGLTGIFILYFLQVVFIDFFEGIRAPLLIAALLSMLFNFYLNNIVTFRAKKIKRGFQLPALIKYIIICSVGLLVNISLLNQLPGVNLINLAVAAFIAGSWNFFLTKWFVWGVK